MRTWLMVLLIAMVVGGAFTYTQFTHTSGHLREFTLLAAEYAYSDGKQTNPTLIVNSGDTVKITVKNVGGMEHEFMIVQDLNSSIAATEHGQEPPSKVVFAMSSGSGVVDFDLSPGEEKTVTFTADKPGVYYYACFDEKPVIHAKLGMWGKFIVEK